MRTIRSWRRHANGRQSTNIARKYASPSTATGMPRKCDCAEVVTFAQLMTPLSEQASALTSV